MPQEYPAETREGFVLNKLNGHPSEKKEFIESEFFEKAGFRRTGNVKYRNSTAPEKSLSVLHGVFHAFSLGKIPKTPFFEVEYDRLPEYPDGIKELKDRYLNIELPKIKSALERYKNPSEDYLRARENLREMYNPKK